MQYYGFEFFVLYVCTVLALESQPKGAHSPLGFTAGGLRKAEAVDDFPRLGSMLRVSFSAFDTVVWASGRASGL